MTPEVQKVQKVKLNGVQGGVIITVYYYYIKNIDAPKYKYH